jgi:hypothetical protein
MAKATLKALSGWQVAFHVFFCVIHSSVGVLGVVLLLVGVEGVRSQRVEALPPSSWGIVLFGNHG